MRFMHFSDVHLGVVPDDGKPWSEQRASCGSGPAESGFSVDIRGSVP